MTDQYIDIPICDWLDGILKHKSARLVINGNDCRVELTDVEFACEQSMITDSWGIYNIPAGFKCNKAVVNLSRSMFQITVSDVSVKEFIGYQSLTAREFSPNVVNFIVLTTGIFPVVHRNLSLKGDVGCDTCDDDRRDLINDALATVDMGALEMSDFEDSKISWCDVVNDKMQIVDKCVLIDDYQPLPLFTRFHRPDVVQIRWFLGSQIVEGVTADMQSAIGLEHNHTSEIFDVKERIAASNLDVDFVVLGKKLLLRMRYVTGDQAVAELASL
jgi:hypothetical protein